MNKIIILFVFTILLTGCSKENTITISQYLTDNNLTAQKHSSGLYYIIEQEGTGERPNINSDVTVHYDGYYTDDEAFDSSTGGNPAKFNLSGVIKGWQIGIPLFKEGGKGKLLIPPHLGYGSQTNNSVRNDASLIFDIELIDVEN